jgi:elongation factor G
VREEAIPADLKAQAETKREEMLDAISMFSDELTGAILEGNVTEEQIRAAIHAGTVSLHLCPVLMGSAYKNKECSPPDAGLHCPTPPR